MKIRTVITLLLLGFMLALALYPSPQIAAQSAIDVTRNEVKFDLPKNAVFSIAASSPSEIQKVTLILGDSSHSCNESTASRPLDFEPATSVGLNWTKDFLETGPLLPGQSLSWQWKIEAAGGEILVTEPQTVTVQDRRFNWKSVTLQPVTVHWSQGDQAFGQSLVQLAVSSLTRLQKDTATTYEGPIHMTVYPTIEAMRSVLISSEQWVGGVAYPNLGLIITSITPGETMWASEVVPHEISHLVIQSLVFNCVGATLPTWLSEGLAERALGRISNSENKELIAALEDELLPPLGALEGTFSAYGDEAGLSYTQSYSVVSFMIAEYGPEKIGKLLAGIKSGQTIDQALQSVYHLDTNGLDAAWRASLGFTFPTPLPASNLPAVTSTTIPTLALWTSAVQLTATSTFAPTSTLASTSTPAPSATPQPATDTSLPPTLAAPAASPVPTKKPAGSQFCGAALPVILAAGWVFWQSRKRLH
jgi:hypothetical protein